MAVRIRLTRVGATKQPTYRVVVADARSARDSRAIETIGHYNPRTEPIELNIDAEKASKWLAQGAQPSDTVVRLFRTAGILPAEKKEEDGSSRSRRVRREVPRRRPRRRQGRGPPRSGWDRHRAPCR